MAKSTSNTFLIVFLFLEKNTSGFVWTPAPLRAPSFCFLTSSRKPHVKLTQALAEQGVSAVLPSEDPAESSSEGPIEKQ